MFMQVIEQKKVVTKETKNGACFVCQETAKLKCSQCKIVSYCGTDCQKLHWQTHKRMCRRGKLTFGEGCPVVKSLVEWENFCMGCCLDCHAAGKANQISYFCDRCNNPFICNDCEAKHVFCMKCRKRSSNSQDA